ncbi:potassium/proton antiporter [Patulibacter minatonensis]|uniref:potassium/proton antiporter n=1 Tax=Patulibacter minatonensis TaxID=298163 RepID=UPI00047D642D|nr:potassium/proton antiporter [Patulibacter minatonensis]
MLEELLLLAGLLLVAGLAASLFAGRLRVPALVVFLLLGMLAGPDELGIIETRDAELIRDVGLVSLVLILFEGGLASGLREIRPVFGTAALLATVGVLITTTVVGTVAFITLDVNFEQGLLLGAIVASTDGAAIFALLRGSTLRKRLARTLEGEAGMNDPVTALLVIGLIDLSKGEGSVLDIFVTMASELAIDAIVGTAIGLLAVQAFQRARLASEGLYPVASLATAILAYAVATNLHGSGLLSAYVAGLILGSFPIQGKRSITAFHDGIAWVAQLGMFLALGLLVNPHSLGDVWVESLVITAALLFLGRPISVMAILTPMRFTMREQIAVSWAGLRGAVPIVFATFPVIAGVPRADEFLSIVFFVVVLTTILQGVTFEGLAVRLGVTTTEPAIDRPLVEVMAVRELGAEVVEVHVRQGDAMVGARVKDLGLPRDALVNVLVRGDEALLPRGSTTLESDDRLHLLVRREVAGQIPGLIERWRAGPVGPVARPARRHTAIRPIFRAGPWDARDGDPAEPPTIAGIEVVERVRLRRDRPGALVVLADGRYGVSGSIAIVGSRQAVQGAARRKLEGAPDDAEAGWWQEVVGACAF